MAGNVSREWGVFLKAFRGESCEDMYIYMYFSRHSWTQPVSFKDTWALEEMFSQIQNVSPCTSHGHRKNEINIASSILTFPLETAKGINRFFSAQIFIYRPSQWKVYHPEFSAPERKKNSLETKNPVELRGQPVKRGRSIWESGICPNKKEGFRCLSCVILSCHSCQTIWLLWPTTRVWLRYRHNVSRDRNFYRSFPGSVCIGVKKETRDFAALLRMELVRSPSLWFGFVCLLLALAADFIDDFWLGWKCLCKGGLWVKTRQCHTVDGSEILHQLIL